MLSIDGTRCCPGVALDEKPGSLSVMRSPPRTSPVRLNWTVSATEAPGTVVEKDRDEDRKAALTSGDEAIGTGVNTGPAMASVAIVRVGESALCPARTMPAEAGTVTCTAAPGATAAAIVSLSCCDDSVHEAAEKVPRPSRVTSGSATTSRPPKPCSVRVTFSPAARATSRVNSAVMADACATRLGLKDSLEAVKVPPTKGVIRIGTPGDTGPSAASDAMRRFVALATMPALGISMPTARGTCTEIVVPPSTTRPPRTNMRNLDSGALQNAKEKSPASAPPKNSEETGAVNPGRLRVKPSPAATFMAGDNVTVSCVAWPTTAGAKARLLAEKLPRMAGDKITGTPTAAAARPILTVSSLRAVPRVGSVSPTDSGTVMLMGVSAAIPAESTRNLIARVGAICHA